MSEERLTRLEGKLDKLISTTGAMAVEVATIKERVENLKTIPEMVYDHESRLVAVEKDANTLMDWSRKVGQGVLLAIVLGLVGLLMLKGGG